MAVVALTGRHWFGPTPLPRFARRHGHTWPGSFEQLGEIGRDELVSLVTRMLPDLAG